MVARTSSSCSRAFRPRIPYCNLPAAFVCGSLTLCTHCSNRGVTQTSVRALGWPSLGDSLWRFVWEWPLVLLTCSGQVEACRGETQCPGWQSCLKPVPVRFLLVYQSLSTGGVPGFPETPSCCETCCFHVRRFPALADLLCCSTVRILAFRACKRETNAQIGIILAGSLPSRWAVAIEVPPAVLANSIGRCQRRVSPTTVHVAATQEQENSFPGCPTESAPMPHQTIRSQCRQAIRSPALQAEPAELQQLCQGAGHLRILLGSGSRRGFRNACGGPSTPLRCQQIRL